MSTPVGHVLIGTAVASVVAQLSGIRDTSRLLAGAAIASILPDFDWFLVLLGFPTKRVHRAATHSLLSLTALITLATLIVRQYSQPVDRRAIGVLAAALISHPLLDLVTTPPHAAANGFGLPLLWPISSRRWVVRQDVFQTPGLRSYRSPGVVLRAVLSETILLGSLATALFLAARLFGVKTGGSEPGI